MGVFLFLRVVSPATVAILMVGVLFVSVCFVLCYGRRPRPPIMATVTSTATATITATRTATSTATRTAMAATDWRFHSAHRRARMKFCGRVRLTFMCTFARPFFFVARALLRFGVARACARREARHVLRAVRAAATRARCELAPLAIEGIDPRTRRRATIGQAELKLRIDRRAQPQRRVGHRRKPAQPQRRTVERHHCGGEHSGTIAGQPAVRHETRTLAGAVQRARAGALLERQHP